MLGHNHLVANTALFGIAYKSLAIAQHKGVLVVEVSEALDYLNGVNYPFEAPYYYLLMATVFYLGSLAPDTDSPNSLLGRFIYIPFVGHRTWTHTAYALAVFTPLALADRAGFFFVLGYFGHLLIDSLSKQGVCWFLPKSGYREYGSGAKVKKNHRFFLYRTGRVSEQLVIYALLLVWFSLSQVSL